MWKFCRWSQTAEGKLFPRAVCVVLWAETKLTGLQVPKKLGTLSYVADSHFCRWKRRGQWWWCFLQRNRKESCTQSCRTLPRQEMEHWADTHQEVNASVTTSVSVEKGSDSASKALVKSQVIWQKRASDRPAQSRWLCKGCIRKDMIWYSPFSWVSSQVQLHCHVNWYDRRSQCKAGLPTW